MELKYQGQLDFVRLARFFRNTLLVCILGVLAGEVLAYNHYVNTGFVANEKSGFLTYVVIPSAISAAAFIFLVFMNRFCLRRGKYFLQSMVAILSISIICIALMAIHYHVGAIYLIGIFPIVAALQFADIKPLVFAYALNMGAYLIFTTLVLPGLPHAEMAGQGFIEILTVTIFLTLITYVVSTILKSIAQLVLNIQAKDALIKQDSFTKLLNHNAFFEHLDSLIMENRATGRVFSLIIYDIDNFKAINDSYGHSTGDTVLLLFADAIRQSIGSGNHEAFRYGGDEFAVLVHGDKDCAAVLAENIKNCFGHTSAAVNTDHKITVSAGICEYNPEFLHGSRDFFSAADFVLYRAKRIEGKDAILTWSHETDGHIML